MRVVTGYFSKKNWVEDKNGKQVTHKSDFNYYIFTREHVYIVKKECCDIIWIFKKDTEELLYHGCADYSLARDNLFNKYLAIHLSDKSLTLVIDKDCNTKFVPYIYEWDADYGMAIIQEDDTYSYIKEDFSLAIDAKYKSASKFNKYGYAYVTTMDDVNQYIDVHGNVILDNAAGCKYFLNEKYILTKSDSSGLYGLIDINGKKILPNFYSNISILNENYFLIIKDGKHGIADLSGNIILEPIYDEIMETQDKFVVRDFSKIEVEKIQSVNK